MINKLYTILSNDEHLLRLLHYPHKKNGLYVDALNRADYPDDIVGSRNQHRIARDHILKVAKKDDIVSVKDCFVLISLGKRKPIFHNHLLVNQEILIDVVVHNEYQDEDYRLDDICDRLDYLVVRERIGMGKTDIVTSLPFEAPTGYYRYQMKYQVKDNKK